MTEETARLDYSKPPSEYAEALARPLVACGSDIDVKKLEADLADWKRSGMLLVPAGTKVSFPSLAEMWAHHKAHNDPPGMRTAWSTGDAVTPLPLEALVEARAKAWAWHDRRHALAARLTLQDAWPRCLRWTDSECDQVDRWIAGGEETPEAFWVRLKPIAPPLEGIDLANYEQTGSPFDAESMWTCRTCRGRPHKSQRVEDERPEHVRHAPGCRVARREALNAATRNADEPTNEPTARRQTT